MCSSFTQSLSATTVAKNITSPNYPSQYGLGRTCLWRISAPFNHFIKIQFIDFDLHYSSTCSSTDDYLEIRDGYYSYSDLIKLYCQKNKPQLNFKLYSSDHYLFIKFKSYYFSNFNRGFKIMYSAVSKGKPMPFR